MSIKNNRGGMTQAGRIVDALNPGYISIEERSSVDLLQYIKAYANLVRYYNQNNQYEGSWNHFLANEDLVEMAAFAENPDIFADIPEKVSRYGKPHYALLLAFVQLLKYPKLQFDQLTEKHLDYFYRKALRLLEKPAQPDRANVIITLSDNLDNYLLKAGTILNAGVDSIDKDIHFEVKEDILLNQAVVSDIKLVQFDTDEIDLKTVHQEYGYRDSGFEKMLLVVLGNVETLPDYVDVRGGIHNIDAVYLRSVIYPRIRELAVEEINLADRKYIIDELGFVHIKDFSQCLDLLYREINRGYRGVKAVKDYEWETVYLILARVHHNILSKKRRRFIKQLHREQGFQLMFQWLFGEPNPGDLLFKMPNKDNSLELLYQDDNLASHRYIEQRLCMSVADYSSIMERYNDYSNAVSWDQVYLLLERAWTCKRNYQYPSVSYQKVKGITAKSVYNNNDNSQLEAFTPFPNEKDTSAKMIDVGFMLSSPLLYLSGGQRSIDIVVDCKPGTIDFNKLESLDEYLQTIEEESVFTAYISTESGWQQAGQLDFTAGQFISRPAVKTYSPESATLIAFIPQFDIFDLQSVGEYLVLKDGQCYEITAYDIDTKRLELRTVDYQYPTNENISIARFVVKRFSTRIQGQLSITYQQSNSSSTKIYSSLEDFSGSDTGCYLINGNGKIYIIKRFIDAHRVEVAYSALLPVEERNDPLVINCIWKGIEPVIDQEKDLQDLKIIKAHIESKNYAFAVKGNKISVTYPENADAKSLLEAWDEWLKKPENIAGRFKLEIQGSGSTPLSQQRKEFNTTDSRIKRYEASDKYGLRVFHYGRISDSAKLVIQAVNYSNRLTEFQISGDTLSITPGRLSNTANSIAADWRRWQVLNLEIASAYNVESRDKRVWPQEDISEEPLILTDRQTKFTEITDIYGNGIRIDYTGTMTDEPIVQIEESIIDSYEFSISDEHLLLIKYPIHTETLGYTLINQWLQWVNSDMGSTQGFDIRPLGEDKWTVIGELDIELQQQASGEISKGIVGDNGIEVTYTKINNTRQKDYAKIIVQESSHEKLFDFQFDYDDIYNKAVLTVFYPQIASYRTVDRLLVAWDQLSHQDGFSLVQKGKGTWSVSGRTEKVFEVWPRVYRSFTTKGNVAITINFEHDQGGAPVVTMREKLIDDFNISITEVNGVAQELLIEYPSDIDKRNITHFFEIWNAMDQQQTYGLSITDNMTLVSARMKDELLNTGNIIQEFSSGNEGIKITYTGQDQTVYVDIKPVESFDNTDIGKKLVWNNGTVFSVLEKIDGNTVKIEREGQLNRQQDVALYDSSAVHFNAFHYHIQLDKDFPPLVVQSLDVTGKRELPSVKMVLRNDIKTQAGSLYERPLFLYEQFNSVIMQSVNLRVSVSELNGLVSRSENTLINTQGMFKPFGESPDKGATFYFSNREIAGKNLDNLQLNLQWNKNFSYNINNIPDLENYYRNYSRCGLDTLGDITNMDYTVQLSYLNKNTWQPISAKKNNLFANRIYFPDMSVQAHNEILLTDGKLSADPLDWSGYYRLVLGQGMLSSEYTELTRLLNKSSQRAVVAQSEYDSVKKIKLSTSALKKAAEIAEQKARSGGVDIYPTVISDAPDFPVLPENDRQIANLELLEPYTPELQGLTVNYQASASINMVESPAEQLESITQYAAEDTTIRMYRYHPFGVKPMGIEKDKDDFFIPHYLSQGYLFIGLEDLLPGQQVSLLIQLLSGSGDVNLDVPEVSWSYLSANTWVEFDLDQILEDTTFGFQDSGIIRFNIPEGIDLDNQLLEANKIWLRASVSDNLPAIPDILTINSQAVEVEFTDDGNTPDRLATPLAAGSINELLIANPAIRFVAQPFNSFDGRRSETAEQFYARISERLKNKNRLLIIQDYETVVLTEFPQLHQVKCLMQAEADYMEGIELGTVIMIVVPKNANTTPFLPSRPKAPTHLLNDIQHFVEKIKPPLVTVSVQNPGFEEIRYRLAIKFHSGVEKGYYAKELNGAMSRFLSPWAYEEARQIAFGNAIYSAAVIDFIERLPYVDYVANFTLQQQIIRHKTFTEIIPLFLTEAHAATTRYPNSVLVSADKHIIDVIDDDLYDAADFRGIGYMIVGMDFWLSRPGPVFDVGIGEMEVDERQIKKHLFTAINGISNQASVNIWQQLLIHAYINKAGSLTLNFKNDTQLNKFTVNGLIAREDLLQTGLDIEQLWSNLLSNNIIDDYGEVLKQGTSIPADFMALAQEQIDEIKFLVDQHYDRRFDFYQAEIIDLLENQLEHIPSQYPFIIH